MSKTVISALLMIGATATCATAADAATSITYSSVQTVGTKIAQLSITTDGKSGVLNSTNILGWSIALSEIGESPATASVLFRDPATGQANSSLILTASLIGTSSSLTLPFVLNPTNHEIGFVPTSGFSLFYSAGLGSVFNNSRYGQNINRGSGSFTPVTGHLVLGTAAVAGVPEPETWAMLLIGFAGVGAAARLKGRRQTVAA